jgi:hypothetical protein
MQQGLERLAHVPDQMKPIGHLEGVRRGQPRGHSGVAGMGQLQQDLAQAF